MRVHDQNTATAAKILPLTLLQKQNFPINQASPKKPCITN